MRCRLISPSTQPPTTSGWMVHLVPLLVQRVRQVRGLQQESRLVLHDGCVGYLAALSALDAGWDWPQLCLYGHGMFVKRDAITPRLLEV
jgi:hypothetical protein